MSVGPVSSQSLISMSVTPTESVKAPEEKAEDTSTSSTEVNSSTQGTIVDLSV